VERSAGLGKLSATGAEHAAVRLVDLPALAIGAGIALKRPAETVVVKAPTPQSGRQAPVDGG
jgi:hypothetical protein